MEYLNQHATGQPPSQQTPACPPTDYGRFNSGGYMDFGSYNPGSICNPTQPPSNQKPPVESNQKTSKILVAVLSAIVLFLILNSGKICYPTQLPNNQEPNRLCISQLPDEIISEIANRLTSFEDLFAFSRVCRSWYSVCTKMRWKPGLMSLSGEEQNFFSFDWSKRYKLELTQSRGKRCHGSPHGWIVTMASDSQVHLLNPLSKVQINLPKLNRIQNQIGVVVDADPFRFIHKCILLKTSEDDDQFLVAVIFGQKHCLAFAKPESDRWITVGGVNGIKDVVLFNGQIHAICRRGRLLCFESDDLESATKGIACHPPDDVIRVEKIYLLESSGELLGVFRYGSRGAFGKKNETKRFLVYMLQPAINGNVGKWQRLNHLGDRLLFVGEGNSWSICTANIVNCRSNCICFTDDNLDQQGTTGNEQTLGGHDIGVFDMVSKKIEHHELGACSSCYHSRAVWFTPSLSFYKNFHA